MMLIFLMLWSCLGVLLVFEAYILPPTTTLVSPACECIFFERLGRDDAGGGGGGLGGASSWANNSSFMSPYYPVPYEPGLLCLLYTFIADQNQVIQIEFKNFDLQPRDADGKCLDYIHIYQNLESPGVDEATEWQHELCGSEIAPRQRFFSKGRALIFDFHSDARHTNNKGFLGEFRFLNKKDYETTGGKLFDRSQCSYLFDNSNNATRKGRIFSPHYPYYYPSGVRCRYLFKAMPGQRIRLIVKQLHLPQVDGSCLDAKTVLLFYDVAHHQYSYLSRPEFRQTMPLDRRRGRRRRRRSYGRWGTTRRQQTSDMHIRNKRSKYQKLVSRYCGESDGQEEAISAGPKALLELITGPNDNFAGRGFSAEYEFIDELPPPYPVGRPGLPTPVIISGGTSGDCNLNIDSDSAKSRGIIRSPLYPDNYPGDLRCDYSFVSSGDTRVQIIFREFSLYLPPSEEILVLNKSVRCHQKYDHLTAYVMLGDRMSEIRTFCGRDLPPRLMSAKNYLTLEFIAKTPESGRNDGVYRFEIEYRFVNDFGVDYKRHQIQRDNNKECHFLFNSTLKNNGTMRSPNYPGLYPRKTDCEYEFHGQSKEERVRIQFTYFDVEGYPQCHNDSQSDYVIFSNYDTEDRTNQRYCGVETPMRTPIVSESTYFRMIFHSNAIFDGTGFFAFYQFINSSAEPPLKNVKPLRSAASVRIGLRPTRTLWAGVSLLLGTFGMVSALRR